MVLNIKNFFVKKIISIHILELNFQALAMFPAFLIIFFITKFSFRFFYGISQPTVFNIIRKEVRNLERITTINNNFDLKEKLINEDNFHKYLKSLQNIGRILISLNYLKKYIKSKKNINNLYIQLLISNSKKISKYVKGGYL